MKDYEFILIILLLIIVLFFILNRNNDSCLRENFIDDSYIFYQGYNSKDNLIDCNLKDYENDFETLSRVCDSLDNCVGFTNKGFLKSSNDLYKDPSFNNENEGIYIKKEYNCDFKEIINKRSANLTTDGLSSISHDDNFTKSPIDKIFINESNLSTPANLNISTINPSTTTNAPSVMISPISIIPLSTTMPIITMPTTLAPTTTITPTTTIAPTTMPPTTMRPTTTMPPTTMPPTTTIAPTTMRSTTTIAPTTMPPTIMPPTTTIAPTTIAPTTIAPTTMRPTTIPPTTMRPTTTMPPTTMPPTTTIAPTTMRPTTIPPTTMRPTTTIPPTTIPPTTMRPTTTMPPTTMRPTTTMPPTTMRPTTTMPPMSYMVTNIENNGGFTLTQNGNPDLWPIPKYITYVNFTTPKAGAPYAYKLYYAPTSNLNNKKVVGTWDANGRTPNISLFPLEPATNYTVSIVLINKFTNEEQTNLQQVQSITITTPSIAPTTIAPTTMPPTTIIPTTMPPTTMPPTTIAPTTMRPTTTTAPTTMPPRTEPTIVKWVICGSNQNNIPTIGYSFDGRTWNTTSNLISTVGSYKSVAYNGNMWVVVGDSLTIVKIATSTNGINWNLTNNYFNGSSDEVCWSGTLWVMAGAQRDIFTGWYKANILTSSDGINWTESFVVNNVHTNFRTVAYNPSNNTWVAAGGKDVYYSKNANTRSWNRVYSNVIFENGIVKITVINSVFVATVMSNRANLIYSSDGINWNIYNTTIPSSVMSNPNKIILYKNKLIVGGFGINQMAYSNNNGLNWSGSLLSFNSLNIIQYIATDNDLIMAVGYDRNTNPNKIFGQILTSYDGISWTPNIIDILIFIQCIASNILLV